MRAHFAASASSRQAAGTSGKVRRCTLSSAPALNTLLITLMLGTVLREGVRLIFPDGSNPKPFPALLPTTAFTWGHFTLRLDSLILLAAGLGPLDAVAYSMSTISSGGFGTRNLSLGDGTFQAVPAIDIIVIVFMVIAGINFNLHYEVFIQRKWRKLVKDAGLALH